MMGRLNIVGFLTGFVDQNKIIEYNQPSERNNIEKDKKKRKKINLHKPPPPS